MSKSHQIPDWRRGAIYWRPLLDGREITIYPLTFGAARFCVGPLADEGGYDTAYRYESHAEAIRAADAWDPEVDPTPTGFSVIETQRDSSDEPPDLGTLVEVLPDDNYRTFKKEHGSDRITIVRQGRRGELTIEGTVDLNDDGKLCCRVDGFGYDRYVPERLGQSRVINDVVTEENPSQVKLDVTLDDILGGGD